MKEIERKQGVVIQRLGNSEKLRPALRPNAIYGGKSVYTARALLRIDVEEEGEGVSARMAPQPKQEVVSSSIHGLIVPNPARDEITYFYSLDKNKKGIFEIRDIMGRLLVQKNIYGNSDSQSVSVTALPSGIYHYQTIVEDVKADDGKIIIIK